MRRGGRGRRVAPATTSRSSRRPERPSRRPSPRPRASPGATTPDRPRAAAGVHARTTPPPPQDGLLRCRRRCTGCPTLGLGGWSDGAPPRHHRRRRRERLEARLWLPDARPAPVVLEALPYRMDDLTATYASEYERLCEEGGFAVCRLDVRGTGSSAGIARDEYTQGEHADICDVIAWLAAQEWSNGRVGMYGTSWSGFNSLQVAACGRPPCRRSSPIYATDDRYTDDVHYMGGALKAVDLVDWVLYMVARNALPPVPAVFGDGWREEWQRRIDDASRGCCAGSRSRPTGPTGDTARSGRLRADRLPDDDHGGRADGYTQQRLPGARGAPLPDARCCSARGATCRRRLAPRAAHRPRARDDPLVRPLARRRATTAWTRSRRCRLRAALDAARRRSAGDARRVAGGAAWPPERLPERGAPAGRVPERRDRGPRRRRQAAWISCAGGLPWASPGTSARTTRSRSSTTGSRSPTELEIWDIRGCELTVTRRRPGRVPVGQALRRLPGRHVGARQRAAC